MCHEYLFYFFTKYIEIKQLELKFKTMYDEHKKFLIQYKYK